MLKKILKALGSVLLLAIVAFLVVQLWYWPRFLTSDARVELPETEAADGEITIMSANVRCYAPDDLFKKSWFYRADLLIEDVNSVKPDIIGFQEVSILHYGYLQNAMPDYDSELMYRECVGQKLIAESRRDRRVDSHIAHSADERLFARLSALCISGKREQGIEQLNARRVVVRDERAGYPRRLHLSKPIYYVFVGQILLVGRERVVDVYQKRADAER